MNITSRFIVMILVSITFSSILLQVVFRYLFNSPLSWSEELARYCMIGITFIGVSVAYSEGRLANVDLLVNAVPRSIQKVMVLISNLLVFVVTVSILKWSINLLLLPGTIHQTSAGIGMPMWVVYACGPIGMFTFAIQILIRLISIILNWNKEASE